MDKAFSEIVSRFKEDDEANVISLLQDVQDTYGYIPEDIIKCLSSELDIPLTQFFSITTFYSQFSMKPKGKNIITACRGTACHVNGSERLINSIIKELELPDGDNTTEDKVFTLDIVNCVGACSIAPVVIINKKVYGRASVDKLLKEIRSLKTDESNAK